MRIDPECREWFASAWARTTPPTTSMRLVEMLRRIARNDYQGQYNPVPEYKGYRPAGHPDIVAPLTRPQRG
jgi:hypothetical protein